MADTMDLGKAGGGRVGTQRYVIGVIDPSSKWCHAEVFQGKAPKQEQTRQVLLNGLKSLRDGLVEHKDGNAAQVFDENGALLHTLVFASDNGNEFKGGFTDAARQDLLDAGLITSGDRFVHRLNLASAPTQAAHIKSKGLGNASFLYQLGRTNGDAVKGSYRREAGPHTCYWGGS
jgi:hypothetical protein